MEERLRELSEVEYVKPKVSWDMRKEEISKNLHEIIEIFEKNTEDKHFLSSLKKLENKFK